MGNSQETGSFASGAGPQRKMTSAFMAYYALTDLSHALREVVRTQRRSDSIPSGVCILTLDAPHAGASSRHDTY